MSTYTCNPENLIYTETDNDGTDIYVCHDCGGAEARPIAPDLGECPGCEDDENADHWRGCPRWDNPENGDMSEYDMIEEKR